MALRKTTDAASKLADSIHGAAQENIPAGNIRDQVRGRTLPPATGTSKGGVTIDTADPQPLGTADPGSGSAVSSGGHVHAHGNLGGGALHAAATGSVAGFQSAADKAKEDLYPAVSGLTPGDVLTALTSSTVGFATPTGGSIPAGSVGDILYFDNTGTLVLLPMAGVPLGSALYATSVGPDQLPAWDIQPPQGGASGDLGNSYPDPIVTGFYGRPIDTGTPTTGDAFVWDGSAYALTQTVSSVNVTQPAAGITATGGPITSSGAITLALANDLAALEGLSSTGLAARTGTDTWAQRSIAGTSNRISVTNGNGVSGNPTLDIDSAYVGQTSITTLGTIGTGTWQGAKVGLAYGGTNADLSATGGANQFLKQSSSGAAITVGALTSADIPDLSATYQPLDADLTAIAGFSGTGLAARTAANTWAQRSIVGTTNRLSVSNGSGAGGNPTLDIDSAYVGQTSITTLGTIGTGTWNATKIGLAYGGTNADLSATGGSGQYLKQASSGAAITVGAIPFSDLTYTGLTIGQVARATSTTTVGFGALSLSTPASITGQLPVGNGGTGLSSTTNGDLLFGSGGSTLTTLAGAGATGSVLLSGTGIGNWGQVPLTTHVTGILPSANGGTGVNNAGTLTNASNTTITGGGTFALGGFTLTAPATGTAALRGVANTFTANQTIAATLDAQQIAHMRVTSGTTGYGIRFWDGTNEFGNFQSLDLSGTSYIFFSTNRQFDGTAWQQLNTRVGGDLQMTGDLLQFLTFPVSSSTPTTQWSVDNTGAVNARTGYTVGGTQVLTSRQTGWNAPTGTLTRGTFAVSGATTASTAQALAALITDLRTHGLINT